MPGPKKRPRLLDEDSKAVVGYPLFQEWYAFMESRSDDYATISMDKVCGQRRLAMSKRDSHEVVARLEGG
jgi:hypothetical protein